MSISGVVQAYFDAWNQHDPDAIVATFVEGGTYSDPTVPPLTGPALAENTRRLFSAFPDLSFDIVSAVYTDERLAVVQWVMRGTNTGSLAGSPPTNGVVALPGVDLITTEGDKIRSVQGYFDQKTFLEQLGLQVIAQPYAIGPITFGTSLAMHIGKHDKPAAFSITSLQMRSDEELQQVREYNRRIMADMAQMPGFISTILASDGKRGYTITAWTDVESPKRLLREVGHREAMKAFFSSNFTEGAMTSVWVPHHINTLWTRCSACGKLSDYEQREGRCACGEPLPEIAYW